MFDATKVLTEYQLKWFSMAKPKVVNFQKLLGDAPLWPMLPEHPTEIAKVNEMLSHISADCSYEQWRNIVWSVLSTGWSSAKQIALDWSESAPDRFDVNSFQTVVNSFNPGGGITFGTLVHYARQNGCEWSNDSDLILGRPQAEGDRFSFKTAAEIRNAPPMRWRIKGLLPESGIGAIYGQSGSGKTFLGFDIAASISLGRSFYGRKVVSCPVVYVALEGGAGLSQRVMAWEKQYNQRLPDTFRIVTDALSLMNTDALAFSEALNGAGLSSGVVIIDTLNQSAPGADENSPSDMGKIISNSMVVQRQTNSLVLLVHHTGKDPKMGMRGHSSLVAAMDVTIKVENKVPGREWSIDKLKDGEGGIVYPFKLETVDLGLDLDGEPITSCVAVSDVFRVNKPRPPKGKNQIPVLEALSAHANECTSILYDDAIRVGFDVIPQAAGKHRKERAISAIEGLIAGGHLTRNGAYLEIV